MLTGWCGNWRTVGWPMLSLVRYVMCAAVAVAAIAPAGIAVAAPPESAITFGYDDLGRLIAASNPEADTAVYRWDQAGNLTDIVEQSSTSVAVEQLVPAGAQVGAAVRIYGTDFSSAPSQDSVTFNGTAATVSSATRTELIVTVPSGATSGTVSVTAPSGSATSSEPFTIEAAQTPTITSVSPTVISVGSAFTVNGTNFDSNLDNDIVGINQGATAAISASGASVEAMAPGETGSGQVTLETPFGAAMGPDVFIPPAGYSASSVVQTARMSLGALQSNTTQQVTIGAAKGVAMVIFDARPGDRVFANLTNASMSSCTLALYDTRNHMLASTPSCNGGYIETQILDAGTQTLLVAAGGTSTGSLTLNLHNVPADVSGTIPTDGSTKTMTITTPGQNGAMTFSGSEGQRVFLNVPSCSSPCGAGHIPKVSILKPDGTTLASTTIAASGYIDTQTLPTSGTYTVFVDPAGADTPTLTLNLYSVPADVSGTIEIGGSPVTVALTTPGRNASLTFSGSASKGIHLAASNDTIGPGSCAAKISIKTPQGGSLVSPTCIASGGKITTTLGAGGIYTIFVDPQVAATGSVTLTLTDPPAGPALAERVDGAFGPPYADPLSVPSPGTFVALNAKLGVGGIRQTRAGRRFDLRRIARSVSAAHAATRHVRSHQRASEKARDAAAPRPIGVHSTSLPSTSPPPPRSLRTASGAWTPSGSAFKGDWTTHRFGSPWERLPHLGVSGGTTALTGQTLKLDGTPLASVTVSIENTNVAAHTDQTGRFVLSGLPSGEQVLVVEGASADNPHASYGRFAIRVDLRKGRINRVGYTIWMPALDEKHAFRLPSPTRIETTLKTPDIPGLEIKIPAGTVIRDSAGKRVRELTITSVPVDRPPFPLPLGSQIPLYFTIQPGGAYLSKAAEIIYPNYTHLPRGQRVPFWNYDPDDRGWFIYGQGTVARDSRHIVPDSGVRIWEFSGAMISGSPLPPENWNPECWIGLCKGGDPVQSNSGLFVMRKTDLTLPDVLPLTLTRTYRPNDNNSYAFGVGMTDSYDLRLWSNNNYVTAELIRPDGSRVHYVRTTPGTALGNAAYKATETPSMFYGSTITQNGGWRLTLRNGTVYQFGYESAGLQWIRDRFGNQITIDRGPANNLEAVTSPNGRWIKFRHDSNYRVTEAEDNTGRIVKYAYDSAGRLTTVVDPAGGVTTYGYDSHNAMTSITDPRGITYLTNRYDANGRIEEQKLADGAAYRFSYTTDPETGKVTQGTMTDPNGNATQTSFNHDGFPTSVTNAAGTPLAQTSSYGVQSGTDFLTSIADPLGHVTSYTYDPNGNISAMTRLAGTANARTTSLAHDPSYSQLTSITDPLGHTTSLGYDSSGELTSVTDPLHDTWTAGYENGDGEPTSITDPLGDTTKYRYRVGEPIATTDALGRTTRRFFDGAGRELVSTNPLGAVTRFGYDRLNDLTTVIDPQGGQASLSYDGDGDVVSRTDPRGHETDVSYDAMNRVSSVTDPLGKSDVYSYDGDGNLISHTDRKGQVTDYGYDALNQLTFTGFKAEPGPSYDSTTSNSYDAGNRLTQAQDSSGGTFSRSWDSFGELTEEAGPQGSVAYSYDAAGRRTRTAVAGQPEVVYSYDEADRLSDISGQGHVGLAHDAAGRVTSTTLSDGISENYTFDNASELTAINYKLGGTTLGDLNYAYDAAGDRSAAWGSFARMSEPGAFASATYNADDELTGVNGQGHEYDADGNLTNDGQSTYTWNARNQLTGLSSSSGSASFGYDPFGRREQSTIHGTTTSYLHDGDNVIQDLSGGNPQTNYLLGLGLDQRYGRSGTQGYVTDPLGSTLALADSSGNLKTTYSYDPFGQATASGESSSNPYQYTGRENDGTGLQYNRARYYSPAQQRFISQDPLGFAGSGPNLYAYAGDSPTNFTDPRGLEDFIPSEFVTGAGVVAGGLCVADVACAAFGFGAYLIAGVNPAVNGNFGELLLNTLLFGGGKNLEGALTWGKLDEWVNSFWQRAAARAGAVGPFLAYDAGRFLSETAGQISTLVGEGGEAAAECAGNVLSGRKC
jgi:RHS repeat-associated protein